MYIGDYIGNPIGDADPDPHVRGEVPGQADAAGELPPELDISSLFDHRVITALREAPSYRALVDWIAESMQMPEATMWDLRVHLALAYAHGKQLDLEGDGLGQPRNGLDDDSYRTVLSIRWPSLFRVRSMHTTYDLMSTLVSGTSSTFEHREWPPATYELVVYDVDAPTAALWYDLMLDAAPEGVGFYFLVVEDSSLAFAYDGAGLPYDDPNAQYAYHAS